MEIVEYARKRIPDLSLTSDVIVGFPGETYEDFQKTLELIRKVGFTSLFTFIYSPRVGTPAAKFKDPVTHQEKALWMGELLKLQEEMSARRTASMVGRTMRVLVEEEAKEGVLNARTHNGIVVEVPGTTDMIGNFAFARITEARSFILRGQLEKTE